MLYTMHEVEVVYDAARFFMNEDIDDLGDEMYECNLRLDRSPFNVNNRGGCLFEGRGTWGGVRLETIIRYSNLTRFNVYFDQHGVRESLFDMITRAGLGQLCTLCSNYECPNFGHCVHINHYGAQRRRHHFVGYNSRPRQHIRTQSRKVLQEQFCSATQKYYPFFTTAHKTAVFAGDRTIDVIDEQEEKKQEAQA